MKTKEIYLSSYCKTCKHCSGGCCQVFKRPVDTKFNRCWYHSDFQPSTIEFKVQKNLEEVMQREELQRKIDEVQIQKELQAI